MAHYCCFDGSDSGEAISIPAVENTDLSRLSQIHQATGGSATGVFEAKGFFASSSEVNGARHKMASKERLDPRSLPTARRDKLRGDDKQQRYLNSNTPEICTQAFLGRLVAPVTTRMDFAAGPNMLVSSSEAPSATL